MNLYHGATCPMAIVLDKVLLPQHMDPSQRA